MIKVNISTNRFSHTDLVTGEKFSWQQEDENAVTTRDEAIAVIQRTIDFWMPKLRDDLTLKGLSLSDATAKASETFRETMQSSLTTSAFPMRFGLTIDDFSF